jgi:hypothetical protein
MANANTSSNSGGLINGIYSNAGTNTINNNTVRDLTSANLSNSEDANAAVIGIYLTGGAGATTITGNTIYSLKNTNATFGGYIYGLYYFGSTTASTVAKNFIHSLSVTGASSTTASIYGIKIGGGTTTYSNNIISLGGNTTTVLVGIWESGANNNNLYFNTVYIGGTLPTGSIGINSHALWSTQSNTRNFRNNIFYNARSNVGTATGYNIAMDIPNGTTLTCDYNAYYAPGTGGYIGYYDGATTNNMPIVTGQDSHSLNTSPGFASAGGITASDYIPATALTGIADSGIPTSDYAGTARAATPTMGAYEAGAPAPTITSFTPSTAGTGTFISITGTNFTGATSVKFGGTEAVSFIVDNATTISAMVANGTTGNVSVITPGGTATSAGSFTFKPAFLNNLTNASNSSTGGGTLDYNGQAFTTGSEARSLSSVDLSITLTGADAVVKIYSSSAGNMGSEIASLTRTYVSGNIYNFKPTNPVTLAANTTYWLVLYSIDNTTFDNTDDITYTGTGTIPSTKRVAYSADAGATWEYYSASDPAPNYSSPFMFALYGNIVTSATWTGATSTDWNTTGNWNTNTVPLISYNVTIPNVVNDPVVNQSSASPAVCNNLTIESGAVLTIAAGKAMTVSGTITNYAGTTGLVIKSDATGDASFIGPATAATVERYVPASKWILLSSPVTSAINSLYTGMYMKQYSEAANAFGPLITATNVALTPGTGSVVWATAEKTVIYSGTINSGTITVTTPKTTQGFTLTGNPFTSAIDWNAASGWNKTNLSASIWVWNQTANQYATWNGSVGTNNGSRYLALGQGFFVQASTTGASLGIASGAQLHNSVSLMRSVKVDPDIMRVMVTGNNYSDEMIIANIPGALPGIDYSFDAQKMMGSEAAPQLYTVKAQTMMTIASLGTIDATTEIPVCIKVGAAGEYTLNFINNLNPGVLYTFLRDNQTMRITSVADMPAVTFTASPLDNPDRFTLLFNSQSIITGTTENKSEMIRVWNASNKLNVVIPENEELVTIEIFNMNGIKLRTITTAPIRDIDLNLNTAMYIVKVKTTKQVQISKIVLY